MRAWNIQDVYLTQLLTSHSFTKFPATPVWQVMCRLNSLAFVAFIIQTWSFSSTLSSTTQVLSLHWLCLLSLVHPPRPLCLSCSASVPLLLIFSSLPLRWHLLSSKLSPSKSKQSHVFWEAVSIYHLWTLLKLILSVFLYIINFNTSWHPKHCFSGYLIFHSFIPCIYTDRKKNVCLIILCFPQSS
jgi:hypothetical protein